MSEEKLTYKLIRRRWARGIRISVNSSGMITVSAPAIMPQYLVHQFVLSKSDWLKDKLAYFSQKAAEHPKIKFTPEKITELKKQTLHLVTPKLAHFGNQLGVSWHRVTIKNVTSRWGSCSRAKNLSFNCRLALLPDEIVDYVVVHELCHLKQMNHSPKFWSLVETIIPNHKRLRKQLHQLGLTLS